MKVSKQVKRAFKEFKATSTATNLSLKRWAKGTIPSPELGAVIKKWLANKAKC